jgi:hypothetical protein
MERERKIKERLEMLEKKVGKDGGGEGKGR